MRAAGKTEQTALTHKVWRADAPPRPRIYECACPCDCDCTPGRSGSQARTLSSPASFYVELTPACNNRCTGCGNVFASERPDGASRYSLDSQQWRALLGRIAPGTNRVKLTGGEPTLFPQFTDIVRHIDALGLEFTVFSNGRWSNSQQILKLLLTLAHFRGFLISLHGPLPAIHEDFCGVPGAFAETVANIRLAVSVGLMPSISTVINRFNRTYLCQTVDFALSQGANHVVFNRYIGTVPSLTLEERDLAQAVMEIEQMRRAGMPVSFGNCIPQCFAENASAGCSAGDTFCTIDPWGNVRPCNHAPITVGNLLEQSIEQVWYSPEMELWRAMVPKACNDCTAFVSCHGGCRAIAMLSANAADPLLKASLVHHTPAETSVHLPRNAVPIGCFNSRYENQGRLLMHGSQTFMLTWEHEELIKYLNGSSSVQQIESDCGPYVLPLLESLYRNGFIELIAER